MHDASEFNPYIIQASHGTVNDQKQLHKRMCMWYELELIPESSEDSGVMTLDEFIPLRAGTVMLRRPGDIVQGIAPVSYNYINIRFDPVYTASLMPYYEMGDNCSGEAIGIDFFEGYYKSSRNFPFLNEIPFVMHLDNFSDIHDLMLECTRALEKNHRDSQIYAKALLLEILIKLKNRSAIPVRSTDSHAKSAAVVRMIEYMRNNYMKPITLDTIAQQVSMSREYICRLFKSDTGMPPMAYLQHIRIFNAKSMLLTTSLTVEEIAAACGYENVNYFYSVFKKACGVTPSQYRK